MLSFIGITLLCEPWNIDWYASASTRSWIVGVSGIYGVLSICWMICLGHGWLFLGNVHPESTKRVYRYMGLGTIMSFFIHPLSALISYGTSFSYFWLLDMSNEAAMGISLGRVALNVCLTCLGAISISRYILGKKGKKRLHAGLYIGYGGIRLHGSLAGSLIYDNLLISIAWLMMGCIIFSSILEVVITICTGNLQTTHIRLFAPRS